MRLSHALSPWDELNSLRQLQGAGQPIVVTGSEASRRLVAFLGASRAWRPCAHSCCSASRMPTRTTSSTQLPADLPAARRRRRGLYWRPQRHDVPRRHKDLPPLLAVQDRRDRWEDAVVPRGVEGPGDVDAAALRAGDVLLRRRDANRGRRAEDALQGRGEGEPLLHGDAGEPQRPLAHGLGRGGHTDRAVARGDGPVERLAGGRRRLLRGPGPGRRGLPVEERRGL